MRILVKGSVSLKLRNRVSFEHRSVVRVVLNGSVRLYPDREMNERKVPVYAYIKRYDVLLGRQAEDKDLVRPLSLHEVSWESTHCLLGPALELSGNPR